MQPQNHTEPAGKELPIHQGLTDLLDLKRTMLKTVLRYLVLAPLLALAGVLVLGSSFLVWRAIHWILER
jgi:hypothetical protein